jgi:multiple sugar transport system ATP-binding protein
VAQVRIDNLGKSYGAIEVLKDINLTVEDGSFVVLVGPSGCGKTTLLRMIAGLEPVTLGSMTIGGRPIANLPPAERGIAMVFQSYALYPHMDVYGNMAFGLRFARVAKAEIDRRVNEAARILQLQSLLKRKPRELSGGQRQRVAIGRAIVREPQVFLFDEPLSNLDAALRINTRVEIAKLHRMLKATIIYVTHDQVEAMTLADKIVVMNKGRIEQSGKPLDLYYSPVNLFVAGFIGSPAMNFLGAKVTGVDGKSARLQLPDGEQIVVAAGPALAKQTEVTLGFRPEHSYFGPDAGPALTGVVEIIERLGESGYAHVKLAHGQTIIAEVRGTPSYQIGDKVSVKLNEPQLHLFDASGNAIARS